MIKEFIVNAGSDIEDVVYDLINTYEERVNEEIMLVEKAIEDARRIEINLRSNNTLR